MHDYMIPAKIRCLRTDLEAAEQMLCESPEDIPITKRKILPSEQTVSEIGTKRDTDWKSIDKASLSKTQTDLKDTQSATIYTVNQMAQALMDSTAAR